MYNLIFAQQIQIDIPYFKGQTYDFIIFQGDKEIKIVEDGLVPDNGKFILEIPAIYNSYTGMGRLLITNSSDGGGLDMVIPGRDFSVSFSDFLPNDKSIIYTDNGYNDQLNDLYLEEQKIFAKHDAMLQAIKAYSPDDINFIMFQKEYKEQIAAYDEFQKKLKAIDNYVSKFTNIVNITRGVGTKILTNEKDKARNVSDYLYKEMDWDALYTSGHWSGVIMTWVDINTQVFNNPVDFIDEFVLIGDKIKDPIRYTNFVKKVTGNLVRLGKDNLVQMLTSPVVASGKITSFDGVLSVYTTAQRGTKAPNLIVFPNGKEITTSKVFKSENFASENFTKSLLLFYNSQCGNCDSMIEQLKSNYYSLKEKGIRVISILNNSNLEDSLEQVKQFPWEDVYYDSNELNYINFKNYAVVGTPTIFLIDKSGEIILRSASFAEIEKEI